MKLSNQKARHLILHLQGLTKNPNKKWTKREWVETIKQMGFVQVDSIQWVERAHHMILFARNQTYRPEKLKELIEEDKAMFEAWTHDASIVPTEFYAYWKHKFERKKKTLPKKFQKWQGKGYQKHSKKVVGLIQENGPIRSRDIVGNSKKKPKQMWEWNDTKTALELLWRTGELAIIGRHNFEKIYGLVEDAIPKKILKKDVSEEEFKHWACKSALQKLGFGSVRDIAGFWDLVTLDEVRQWIDENKPKKIVVEGNQKNDERELFASPNLTNQVRVMPQCPKRVRIMSPFDPVVRDRDRLKWLFGFEYKIEIYVPEHKRKWGYYVFPILEGSQFIGRIDMKANQKNKTLEVKKLWMEKKFESTPARKKNILGELKRQAKLTQTKKVVWGTDKISP